MDEEGSGSERCNQHDLGRAQYRWQMRCGRASGGMQAQQALRVRVATLREFVPVIVRRLGNTRKKYGNDQQRHQALTQYVPGDRGEIGCHR